MSSDLAPKASSDDFAGRFREIISDPLNVLIRRCAKAGLVAGGSVCLHNGMQVPLAGNGAYYGNFSAILALNRGVHEPLEEYVFQEVLKRLPSNPIMLELGAYWGHYSMWLKSQFPNACVHLVEPDNANIQAGIENFKANNLEGTFTQAFVCVNGFVVDAYLRENSIDRLSILHSDIQGYELEMLEGSHASLEARMIDYIFVSTHSQSLHAEVERRLKELGYIVEISSDFDNDSTSYDGLVFASSPLLEPVFPDFIPLGRQQIGKASPTELVDYLSQIVRRHTL